MALSSNILYFSAFPDVLVRQLNEDWEFIVIACDGIWEVLSNEVCTLKQYFPTL